MNPLAPEELFAVLQTFRRTAKQVQRQLDTLAASCLTEQAIKKAKE
jgi:hypothetical protein